LSHLAAPIDVLLVANRGEIALRVARSARQRGLRVAMVASPRERFALHTRAGDLCLAVPDYLDGDAIVVAGRRLAADGAVVAVHPGYGFLAENAAFARAVQEGGLVWVGPSPEAIAAMGDKSAARQRMVSAGVPVVPGYDGADQEPERLAQEADRIGYPVLVKAAAGGGGKGMAVVRRPQDLGAAVAASQRLARGAFGDDRVLLERYLSPARHVEVQVLADTHGTVLHLFERECSLQRRHQKVIEEAPSPALDEARRQALCADAVRVAQAVAYTGAGTVEFILGPDGSHYFLEMNTRLQVEHAVTEAITGLDLVDLQLAVAEGRPLHLSQDQIHRQGWAIEARLYAEDAQRAWQPSTGRLGAWRVPEGVRVDTGVGPDSEVGPDYDPMLAKVIAHGSDREQARRRLLLGLERLVALGPTTNRGALQQMLRDPRFVRGQLSTEQLLDFQAPPLAADWPALCGVVAWLQLARRAARPLPEVPAGWRNNRWRDAELRLEAGGRSWALRWRELSPGHLRVWESPAEEAVPVPPPVGSEVRLRQTAEGLCLEVDGLGQELVLVVEGDRVRVHRPHGDLVLRVLPDFELPGSQPEPGGLLAPMAGRVVSVAVEVGARVEQGAVLVLLEAMKMEQVVRAPRAGRILELRVVVGQQVEADMVLVRIEEVDDAEQVQEEERRDD